MTIRNVSVSARIIILMLFFTPVSVLMAQDSVSKANQKSKWSFLVEPYLMFPNMSGNVGIGDLPEVTVDANAGDIFSRLQFGAMLFLEASNDKWAINSDVLYMSLKQDVKTGTVINSGEATAKQFAWEVAGLRRATPWLELGVGGLLNSIKSGIDITVNNIGGGTTNRSKELSKVWFDPMLIARVKNKPGVKFIYSLRGEIGGFGVGSDFAWQIQAYAGYRFSKLFQLTGGYRIIGIDYDKGTGQERFLYDINTFGPVIRFGFNF